MWKDRADMADVEHYTRNLRKGFLLSCGIATTPKPSSNSR
jgi:hypothetical protein